MSVVKYVTLAQLAKQAGRSYSHIWNLSKRGLIKGLEKFPGIRGYRITVANANRFLARHWPGTPLFPEE